MHIMLRTTKLAAVTVCIIVCHTIAATDETSKTADRESTIKALEGLGSLIGEWKGVAQPRRGSNSGAWSEKAQAAWNFENKTADLVVTFEPGQQFHQAAFSLAADGNTPTLALTPLMGEPISLLRVSAGDRKKSDDDNWIFESTADNIPQTRCTVRIISNIRVTLLFEEKSSEKGSYRRLSEIGMTRAGSRLAGGSTGERQCIVTGGLGTMKVSFEDKTYYVCCEGCRQAFDADPKGTIEAYRERLKAAGGKSQ